MGGSQIKGPVKREFNINSAAFLGAGDKHSTFLNYFYENKLEGDDHSKFEQFKSIICMNEDLQKLMEDNDINIPSDSTEMCSQDGFFDTLNEEKADLLYNAIRKLI
jgi:hypothetical protein